MTSHSVPSGAVEAFSGAREPAHATVVRDPWIGPAVRILNAMARSRGGSPHAACKLPSATGLTRPQVDATLRWLQRRALVEHVGAWRLTGLGEAAVRANSDEARTEQVEHEGSRADSQQSVRDMLQASIADLAKGGE